MKGKEGKKRTYMNANGAGGWKGKEIKLVC
jgi:hypothetical protein